MHLEIMPVLPPNVVMITIELLQAQRYVLVKAHEILPLLVLLDEPLVDAGEHRAQTCRLLTLYLMHIEVEGLLHPLQVRM